MSGSITERRSRRNRIASSIVVVTALAISSSAQSQPPEPPTPEPAEATPEPPTAPDNPTERARELYDRGARHYDLGEFDAAIDLFKQAYALSGAPGLLFNIAQAYRLMGPRGCRNALAYYDKSLERAPEAANREEIEHRIAEMKRCAARPVPAPKKQTRSEQPPPQSESDASASWTSDWLGHVLLGTGVAAAAVGGVLVGLAEASIAEANDDYASYAEARGAPDQRIAGWIVVGAGGVLALAGILHYALYQPDAPSVAVSVGTDGATFAVRGIY